MASLSPTHPQPCIARFTLNFSSSLVRRCFQIHLLPSLRYLFCILCRCTLRCWPATPGDPTASGSSYSPFSGLLLGGVPGSCEKVLAPSCGVHCLSSIGAVPLRGGGRPALAPVLLRGGCPVCSVSLASGPTVVFASYAVIIMMLHLTKARR